MGVYGISVLKESSSLSMKYVEESMHTPDLAGAMMIVAENEENYSKLMRNIGIGELVHYESTGTEFIYEAKGIQGFFKAIKDFFVSLFNKVKALIAKFIAFIDSKTMKDSAFVKKYKSALTTMKLNKFEYEGYEYSFSGHKFADLNVLESKGVEKVKTWGFDYDKAEKYTVELANNTDVKEITEQNKEYDKNSAKYEDELRAAMCSGTGRWPMTKVTEEATKAFRGGKDSKKTLKNLNVNTLLTDIENAKKDKDDAEENLSKIKDAIDDKIDKLNDVESALNDSLPTGEENDTKGGDRAIVVAYVNKTSALIKAVLNTIVAVNGVHLQALQARRNQNRAICVAMLSYKVKESADESFYESGDFFNVDFN